ncbi:MAG: hypothetical protein WBG70_22840 [Spirulinaceae cyanobacterium]
MKEIIENVRQIMAEKKLTWAYPIALKLQEYDYNLAIQWAIECLQIYSSEIKSDQLSRLDKYVQQAMDSQNALTSSQCREISREIWYLPGREEIQTAVSQLWGAISEFKYGEEQVGAMYSSASVELALPNESDYDLLEQYLESAVRICDEYQSQN